MSADASDLSARAPTPSETAFGKGTSEICGVVQAGPESRSICGGHSNRNPLRPETQSGKDLTG